MPPQWSPYGEGIITASKLICSLGASLLLAGISWASAQNLLAPSRVWSVGPVTKRELTMGVSVGSEGASLTGPRVDSQTASTFSPVRSVVFAGNRVVPCIEGGH